MKRIVTTNRSLSVNSVVGLVPRYSKEKPMYSTLEVGEWWQEAAQKQFAKTGIYVSVIITNASVVYRTDSGCPVGGEPAIDIRADSNPIYSDGLPDDEYFNTWKNAFLVILEEVAIKLNQTTVTAKFSDGQLVYLTI